MLSQSGKVIQHDISYGLDYRALFGQQLIYLTAEQRSLLFLTTHLTPCPTLIYTITQRCFVCRCNFSVSNIFRGRRRRRRVIVIHRKDDFILQIRGHLLHHPLSTENDRQRQKDRGRGGERKRADSASVCVYEAHRQFVFALHKHVVGALCCDTISDSA